MNVKEEMHLLLKEKFKFDRFREGQEEIITSLAEGQDTLAVLPTGKGKSLCYQLAGYLLEGLTVVVSPLISLMEDQVIQLQQLGEKRVVALNSSLGREEKAWVLQHLRKYKFLFLSPEMLFQENVVSALQYVKIALLVVDEAHCISIWGNDFRPEYRQLGRILPKLGHPLLFAATATATEKVISEIQEVLFPGPCFLYQQSVDRQNIRFFVRETDDKIGELAKLLSTVRAPGVIYCSTRKNVEHLYQLFSGEEAIGYYHGGLAPSQRSQLQQQFSEGRLSWLIATNAFGMGINKADIRSIIHYDLPASLENYIQEIGRAGRDGRDSQAILLYKPGDEGIHHFFQSKSKMERELFQTFLTADEKDKDIRELSELQLKWLAESQCTDDIRKFFCRLQEHEKKKANQLAVMLKYIHSENCRRTFILNYFGESNGNENENCCDFHKTGLLLKKEQQGKKLSSKTRSNWQEIMIKLFKEKKKVSF